MLTTAQVAKLAAVAPSTVKRWAEQGILPHTRTAGGHRRFERQALERFLAQYQVSFQPPVQQASAPATPRDWLPLLVNAEHQALDAALHAARNRLGTWYRVAEELGEVLQALGECWANAQVTIAEEHIASAALGRALQRLCDTLPPVAPTERMCALCCAPTDDHTLGLNLAELCLREAGWRTLWLGRATPVPEMQQLLASGKLNALAISASVASDDGPHLNHVITALGPACQTTGTQLFLGGRGAWPELPDYGVRLHAFPDFHALIRS